MKNNEKQKARVFTESELTKFGEYLLSKERTDLINGHYKEGDGISKEERLSQVYHADFENWKASDLR